MEYVKHDDKGTLHPSDHLESLLFLKDHCANWHCFDSAEE